MSDLPRTYGGDVDFGQINYVYCETHDRFNQGVLDLTFCASLEGECVRRFGTARYDEENA